MCNECIKKIKMEKKHTILRFMKINIVLFVRSVYIKNENCI
jgi:hypothetical protein